MEMHKPTLETGPLRNQSKQDIEFLLRGFPEYTITSALELRRKSKQANIECCLLGILKFYLPAGAEPCEISNTGKIRIREDLGLDSLSLAESMFKIEEIFDIYIDTTELAEIKTIADAGRMLAVKLAANEQTSGE